MSTAEAVLPRCRLGLLGGSFDPPHLAHRALGRVARDTLALDGLVWLPAGAPWQKAHRRLAGAADREAMLRLLLAGEPGCTIDTRELHRPGPTYTLDTVRELQGEWAAAQSTGAPGVDAFLVIGQDQYGRFDTWHGWRELLDRLTLAVAAREGEEPAPPPALAGVPHRVVRLDLPRIDIAASDIRGRLATTPPDRVQAALAPLVGDAVAGYIARHRLYPPSPEHPTDTTTTR